MSHGSCLDQATDCVGAEPRIENQLDWTLLQPIPQLHRGIVSLAVRGVQGKKHQRAEKESANCALFQ